MIRFFGVICAALLAAFILLFVSVPGMTQPREVRCGGIDTGQICKDTFTGKQATLAGSSRKAKRIARAQEIEQRAEWGTAIVPPETQRTFLRGTTILPHPDSCPRRAFCGCGASVEVFGRSVRGLWLAANWLAFPRAAPAPGMAAARRGHVFIIKEVLSDGNVLAYDANSGGHQTRLHVRSLSGFTVVNPHGGNRYAEAG